MADHQTIIRQTKKWLSTVIIAQGLCPFAKREIDNHRIHYAVIDARGLEGQLEQIILECGALSHNPERETSLLIFPKTLSSFEDYLDLLGLANKLLETQGYEGTYQLASFHPKYIFEGSVPDDPSNYTNRSPYPTIHILREASVEAAVKSYPNPEKIPERNVELTQRLGLGVMKDLLAACYK